MNTENETSVLNARLSNKDIVLVTCCEVVRRIDSYSSATYNKFTKMLILQPQLLRRALNSSLKLVMCGSCRSIVVVQVNDYYRSLGPIEKFAQAHRRAFGASAIIKNTEKTQV